MTRPIGIDLNGLCDVSVNDVATGILRGGGVPSVLVVQPRQNQGDPLQVIAGEEAAMAIEGRGWQWPNSARVIDLEHSQRVPLHHVLEALSEGSEIQAAGETRSPTELLAAAIAGLAHPHRSAPEGERPAVITVPDNGRFLEEARQRLINAAVQSGLTPTLLWRPVAALLGIEPLLNDNQVLQLSGKTVGVLSCLEDGVHATRLDIEIPDGEESYFVPTRREPGIIIPYRKPISALATDLAKGYASLDDPQEGWQLLWGSGLVLSWLLRLEAKDTVTQTTGGWKLVPSKAPIDLPQVEFAETTLGNLVNFLEGVHYTIFEGPALETNCGGMRLAYFLREKLPRTARPLSWATQKQHLAARGCVVYQQRKAKDRITYYDHLPQLRLAVLRDGTDPDFLELIDPTARVEGGTVYDGECDLGLSVKPGTPALNFYLLREGNAKPRHIKVELPDRLSTAVPIRLRIRQQPAQGTARLTLVATTKGSLFRPVELHWEHMEEQDLSEDEVLERLREESVDVPPVQPQPSHPLLWTAHLASAGGSLAQLLPQLADILENDRPSSNDLLPLLDRTSRLLTRRSSPAILTRQQVLDWTLYRAVSSDGALPEEGDELSTALLDQFDKCLERLGELITSDDQLDQEFRSAIIRLGGWCFLRCPASIRRHLIETTRSDGVPDARVYFRAMGKVFVDDADCRAFFDLLERQLSGQDAKFKLHEIEGLFYMLSLREEAPLALTNDQATLFAGKLLDRIQEYVRAGKPVSRLVNASLKTYAGLMRYRLVRPDYMTPQDTVLGEKQELILGELLQRARRKKRVQTVKLTKSLIEWSEKRGADRTILQWDPEED